MTTYNQQEAYETFLNQLMFLNAQRANAIAVSREDYQPGGNLPIDTFTSDDAWAIAYYEGVARGIQQALLTLAGGGEELLNEARDGAELEMYPSLVSPDSINDAVREQYRM